MSQLKQMSSGLLQLEQKTIQLLRQEILVHRHLQRARDCLKVPTEAKTPREGYLIQLMKMQEALEMHTTENPGVWFYI